MSAPEWDSTDAYTSDLLELVATGITTEPDTAEHEWDHFVFALHTVALMNGGTISPNGLRPQVRGEVAPRRIGAFTNRALKQGLVVYTGEWEVSDDLAGRNAGKPARVMAWVGGAS
ncbi:hypothetical protein [Jatrophihabitans sp.]|uniref:hypothetical protein n=1 Tax=Jatrophihabitans sp. TaxID=1932789 RepID=UPI0030C68C1A|nr:hypothetical protein [Jatrophihabitans sp.]